MPKSASIAIAVVVFAALYYFLMGNGGGIASDLTALGQPSPQAQALAQAIALAEGFNVNGSIPQRANNPGDITDVGQNFSGDTGQRIGQNIIVFATPSDGWNALYSQVNLILSGSDPLYPSTDTLSMVGGTYANDPVNWPANVASVLGVSVNTTLGEIAQG